MKEIGSFLIDSLRMILISFLAYIKTTAFNSIRVVTILKLKLSNEKPRFYNSTPLSLNFYLVNYKPTPINY